MATWGVCLALQAQAGDVKGVMQTKTDLDDSVYSHSAEAHTGYVRWAFQPEGYISVSGQALGQSACVGGTCYIVLLTDHNAGRIGVHMQHAWQPSNAPAYSQNV